MRSLGLHIFNENIVIYIFVKYLFCYYVFLFILECVLQITQLFNLLIQIRTKIYLTRFKVLDLILCTISQVNKENNQPPPIVHNISHSLISLIMVKLKSVLLLIMGL